MSRPSPHDSPRAPSRMLALSVLCLGAALCQCRQAPGNEGTAPLDAAADSTAGQPAPRVAQDWIRFGHDAARTSTVTGTGIAATDLRSLHEQSVQIDGTVDASAIYLHGVTLNGATHDVFFVTTTYGKTLAIDADSGSVLWRFTPPGYDGWAGSYRITTATPAADPGREFIYAAAPDGVIRKLSVSDGSVAWSTSITTLPTREKIAAPLNVYAGHVIATTGGYIGDAPPYQGHVAIIDAASGGLLHVWNALCSDRPGIIAPASCSESGAAIWGRAGAVVDTASGDLFVATGDGHWNGTNDWGDAVLELDPDATKLLGNYTPSNTESLDASDRDLGSTSPVLLGGGLVAQGGKDELIRLLDWSAMRGASPHRGGELETVPTPSGDRLFTAPAVWRSGGQTWIFAADGGGTAAWVVAGNGLDRKWKNGNAGTSPVVADGLLYVYDPGGAGLRVYDAASGRLVGTLGAGSGHWNSPIIVDGRIALPEGNANRHRQTGVLDIWR